MFGVMVCGGVRFRAVVCRGVMFGLWGVGLCPPPPARTITFLSKPRSMQPPHTLEAAPGSLPPPRVPKIVRPNKYACPVVCVVMR